MSEERRVVICELAANTLLPLRRSPWWARSLQFILYDKPWQGRQGPKESCTARVSYRKGIPHLLSELKFFRVLQTRLQTQLQECTNRGQKRIKRGQHSCLWEQILKRTLISEGSSDFASLRLKGNDPPWNCFQILKLRILTIQFFIFETKICTKNM